MIPLSYESNKKIKFMKKFLTVCLLTLFVSLPLTSFRMADNLEPSTKIELLDANAVSGSMVELARDFSDELTVKATYYNAVISQCDSTPLVTASGAVIDTTRTTELRWCAISRDLHKRYGGPLDFGDVIEIEAWQGKYKIKGKYVVQDLMNKRWSNRIDILMSENDRGITYDSAKIKHKKFRKHNQKIAEGIRAKEKTLRRQVLRHGLQKIMGKVPYVGINNELAESGINLKHTVLLETDVYLNRPLVLEI